jgi:hypothetical protein
MKAPETVTLVVTFANGGVGIMRYVTTEYAPSGAVRWRRAALAGDIEAEIRRTQWPAETGGVVSWRPLGLGEQELTDRTFREAWVDQRELVGPSDTGPPKGKLVHDMAKVRDLHLTRLRQQRDAALAGSDALLARAQDQNKATDVAALRARRQALRDMPTAAAPALAAAATVEAVQAITLDGLVP